MYDDYDRMARIEREIEKRMEAACEKDGWYVAVAMMPPESTMLHIEKFGETPVADDDAQAALDSTVAFAKAEFGTEVTVERFDEKIPNTRALVKDTTLHLILVQYRGPKMANCELVGETRY